MGVDSYTDPVAKLLKYGECQITSPENWDNYAETAGLTEADIPELIRLATDSEIAELPSDRIEVWGNVHAWRALAQFRAEAAIEPLLQLLGMDDDWTQTELPTVFSLIGPASIPPLEKYLADGSQDVWGRIAVSEALENIAQVHPDSRDACVAVLRHQLEQFETEEVELTSFLITSLVELKVVEAADLIDRVYQSGQVDEMMAGTWPSVQVDLGLKQQTDFSEADLKPKVSEEFQEFMNLVDVLTAKARQPQGFGNPPPPKDSQKKKKKK